MLRGVPKQTMLNLLYQRSFRFGGRLRTGIILLIIILPKIPLLRSRFSPLHFTFLREQPFIPCPPIHNTGFYKQNDFMQNVVFDIA